MSDILYIGPKGVKSIDAVIRTLNEKIGHPDAVPHVRFLEGLRSALDSGGEGPVQLTRKEKEWILAITGPRVAADPTGQYGDPGNGIDSKLRASLEAGDA